ncbi:MAG: polyphosphate polymerase domain-containing protein [Firmicutes bacterium]|nr:polyphosphate polymerase domain-containing protein [Bacillota bacterium]
MNGYTFERRELKYRITDAQRAALEAAFGARMVPDEHGESTICNIYYDTADYRLIRASLEKPAYKEKLRLRSYGVTEPGGEVFLELKKKYKGIVYKRRITLPEDAAGEFIAGRAPLGEHGQIGREIEYFTAFYAPLLPAVHLSYERSAWFSREDRDLRITFDKNIRFRQEDVSLTLPAGGRRILPEGESLMEIKAAAALPLWLVSELDTLGIYQSTFSKYGEAYKAILAGAQKTFGGKTA